ncbi:DMT family transporter [Roseovarius sp. SCSIO 43702]|uniref:DMT family transporter n=1 Tax=Roseovarius sp. SCSIO 43702 TaxID=2823043 RepID=UPI001C73A08B|nr:DMT family transporter [Roseovarius sp. SCSIO 43702]QYX56649.1 DMT family transporter [Roseovarius sp. SCSIO 43702]
MTTTTLPRSNLLGALCVAVAALCFSLNDMGIKFLSSDYALHQVVFIRSLVGAATLFALVMPFAGGFRLVRTRRLRWHLARGLCVVFANSFLFLGLAVLPIADAVAIFFISPLVITLMSVIFLGETVGPRRWAAIAVGFVGVLVIVRPGTSAFQVAALFPMISAVLYGTMHIIARRIGSTESAATMTFYILVSFMVVSVLVWAVAGDGRYATSDHPSAQFLLRAWRPVDRDDIAIFVMLGTSGVLGGLLISQAYRIAEAAFAAPFEYVSMPMAIIWGITVFGTFPVPSAWIGIVLIVGSGLFLIWAESRRAKPPVPRSGVYK